jgi:GH25 family lysozyme M1 (1,4-beta-N-acetylmuramidase)
MNRTVRARALALAVGTTATLLLGSSTSANATTAEPTARGAVADNAVSSSVTGWIHAHDHQMGSQIRAHEHVGTTAVSAPLASAAGMDVSGYQGDVDWGTAAANGATFAYVKATESTDYTNPYFAQQYDGSYGAGIIRGSYHFAIPSDSDGATQADYFVANGGGWSADGKTLPGALDIEWNPYGADCYGLTQAAMVGWIQSFVDEYQARTGRWPVIYTAANWWSECTGNTGDLSATDPLWLASYASSPGPMPYNWAYQTIWQFADSGTFPGDQDSFNGDISGVLALANG